jgi:ABC-type branched-subunit amino acid transport system substrate-binding protein
MTVNGKKYKIDHKIVDNKCDVSLSVSNFHRFVGDGAVVVRSNWTPGMVSLKPLAEKAKVPVFGGGGNRKVFDPPSKYMYGAQPSYPGVLCAGVKWYKENVWKGKGKMKVGLLLWDTGYGRASHIDAVYDYLKDVLGVEVLPTIFFPVKCKDFTPQLMRFKSEGADLIYLQALAGQYAMLAKDAKRLKVTPKTGLMATLWCLSDKYVQLAGDAANGTYGVWHWYVAKADDKPGHPVVQKVHDSMEKYRGNRYYDVNYFQGWMHQYLMQHALELAIKKYGFPVTGEQVAEVTANMPAWDWGLSRSFSGYAGGDRHGWHEARVYKVEKGEIVPVSGWLPEPPEFLKMAPWIVGKGSKQAKGSEAK